MSTEKLIYPMRCIRYEGDISVEVPYELYLITMRENKVGDKLVHYAGAPGSGKQVLEITRMDDTGVYGKEISNTIRVD